MVVRCDKSFMNSNKFLVDVNANKLVKWRAYRELEYTLSNLFGPEAHIRLPQILTRIKKLAPQEAHDRALNILCISYNGQKFGEMDIGYRHEVMKIVFTAYGPKILATRSPRT